MRGRTQKYIPEIYSNRSKISKKNAKYQAAAGPAWNFAFILIYLGYICIYFWYIFVPADWSPILMKQQMRNCHIYVYIYMCIYKDKSISQSNKHDIVDSQRNKHTQNNQYLIDPEFNFLGGTSTNTTRNVNENLSVSSCF